MEHRSDEGVEHRSADESVVEPARPARPAKSKLGSSLGDASGEAVPSPRKKQKREPSVTLHEAASATVDWSHQEAGGTAVVGTGDGPSSAPGISSPASPSQSGQLGPGAHPLSRPDKHYSTKLILPPTGQPSAFKLRLSDAGWQILAENFVAMLVQLNGDAVCSVGAAEVVAEACMCWVKNHEGVTRHQANVLSRAVRKHAKRLFSTAAQSLTDDSHMETKNAEASSHDHAAEEGHDMEGRLESDTEDLESATGGSEDQEGDYSDQGSGAADGNEDGSRPVSGSSPRDARELDEDGAAYRERYFPGLKLGPEDLFCVACASHGHTRSECPERRGRVTLRRASIVTLRGEDTHVRKVRFLPLSCCFCGGAQGTPHASTQCPVYPAESSEFALRAWCRLDYEQFLDPESTNEALAYKMPEGALVAAPTTGARPNLGKSIVPQRHVVFEAEDDDDEDEAFIRPPVERAGRGRGRARARGGRIMTLGRGGTSFSLPRGPPPSGPPAAQRAHPDSTRRNNNNNNNNSSSSAQATHR